MAPISSDSGNRAGLPLDRGAQPKGPRAPKSGPGPAPLGARPSKPVAAEVAADGLDGAQRAPRESATKHSAMPVSLPAPQTAPQGPRPMVSRFGQAQRQTRDDGPIASRHHARAPKATARERSGEQSSARTSDQQTGSRGESAGRRPLPFATTRRNPLPEQPVSSTISAPPLPPKPIEYKQMNPALLRSLSPSSSHSGRSTTSIGSSRSDGSAPSSAATTASNSSTPAASERLGESRALLAIGKHSNYASFVSHLEEMKKPYSYGTEVELEAMARMLGRPIHVYRTERTVETQKDGTRNVQERVATFGEVTIGSSQPGSPLTLRHRTEVLASGGGAESDNNHYDMVANLPPQAGRQLSLAQLDQHTQKSIGDGSCLFRSVSSFLEMEQDAKGGAMRLDPTRQETDAHKALRQRVVSWERDHALTELDYGLKLIDLV